MINLLHAFSSKGLAEEEGGMESKMSNYWVVGMCVLAVSVGVWWWNRRMGRRGIPKGNLGWPWIGETLDFISSGYSSNPVSFMQKRQSLYVSIPNCTSLLRGSIASTRNHCSCMLLYIPHSYIDIYVCIIIDKFLAAAPLCMSLISSSLFFLSKGMAKCSNLICLGGRS